VSVVSKYASVLASRIKGTTPTVGTEGRVLKRMPGLKREAAGNHTMKRLIISAIMDLMDIIHLPVFHLRTFRRLELRVSLCLRR
jgi:hypothetical protein